MAGETVNRRRWAALSNAIVEVMRPCGPDNLTPAERLVGYCIVLGDCAGAPLNLSMLARQVGMPRNTVRRAVQRFLDLGWAVKTGAGGVALRPGLLDEPMTAAFELERKMRAICAAADALRATGFTYPQARRKPGRVSKSDTPPVAT